MKNKWLIALSAVGIHICIGSVYAWSVLVKPIMAQMGFTLKETTWTFSLAILFLGLSAGFLGGYVEKYGPRKSGLTSTCFFGLGMFGTALALYLHSLPLLYLFTRAPHVLDAQIPLPQLRALYLAVTGFLLLGIWDDIRPISPRVKLAVQAALSLLLVGAGFMIEEMTSPFGGKIPLGWLGGVLSVFWILTIVNAINFIDGLDGLAAGVVFFAAVANFLIALHPWQNFICVISLALMGATLGFLPYNFSPARIFMGDAGSLYLGALLAGLSLGSNTKGATALSLSLPLVILSIPLLDTVLTIIRRGRRGFHFFTADREHLLRDALDLVHGEAGAHELAAERHHAATAAHHAHQAAEQATAAFCRRMGGGKFRRARHGIKHRADFTFRAMLLEEADDKADGLFRQCGIDPDIAGDAVDKLFHVRPPESVSRNGARAWVTPSL